MVNAWNLADVLETIAAAQSQLPAVIQGQRVATWENFDSHADRLAEHLLAAGLGHQSKVMVYLYNSAEYLEAYYAAFKAGLVPVNTNYRYGVEELHYLFDNADAEAVVFHTVFSDKLETIRPRLPNVKTWIAIREGDHPTPSWAVDYNELIARKSTQARVSPPGGRGEDDLMLLYTGGTTGMPKGVMLRQDDIFVNLGTGADPDRGLPPLSSLSDLSERAAAPAAPPIATLVACPLMHGTGIFNALRALCLGGTVMLLPSRRFSAEELWDVVDRVQVQSVVLVGMAFAQPMLEVLEANPGRWSLASLRSLSSTGTMWSQENKQGLLRHCKNAVIVDILASSEAPGFGRAVSSPGNEFGTGRFTRTEDCAVFTDDGRRVQPGSGERGMLAVTGRLPIGYYKDATKTAETFRVIEGKRWSMPGDWAEIESDGTIKLLGRGSMSINSGGEKVFPEEVEEALKSYPKVRDAIVVGVPDPRFGERICAIVEAVPPHQPTLDELRVHVRARLADYKAPKELVLVESVDRAANGKVDYRAAKALALAAVARKQTADK